MNNQRSYLAQNTFAKANRTVHLELDLFIQLRLLRMQFILNGPYPTSFVYFHTGRMTN